MKKERIVTDVWAEYDKGVSYNRRVGLFEGSEKNFNFFFGKQWEGADLGGIEPIVKNIIKPTVKYKVGVVHSKAYQIFFDSNTYKDALQRKQLQDYCDLLNKYTNRTWERSNINRHIREAVKSACIDAEGIIYFYDDNGKMVSEEIDKTNIYYGNENDDDIQSQPYLIISFRRPVEQVQEEARNEGVSEEDIENIVSDSEYLEQSNPMKRVEEISPMCLVLLKLYKKDGVVWMKKCTKFTTIVSDESLGLTKYPVAHFLWERVKGSARGIGEVEQLIANQIEINKIEMRRAISVRMCAYPKLVANTAYISDTSTLAKVGATVEVDEMAAQDINKVVSYLNPTSMSADAKLLSEDLTNATQNLAGAGDTANGTVDPEKTSGRALLAVQQAQQQPLNEQVETYKQFLHDIAEIWVDMMKVYADNIELINEKKDYQTNETVEQVYTLSKEELASLELDIKIEITPKGAFDKFAMEQSIENLFMNKFITLEELAKVLPEDSVLPIPRIKEILQDREEKEKAINAIQQQVNALDGAVQQAMTMEEQRKQQEIGVQEGEMLNEMSEMPS